MASEELIPAKLARVLETLESSERQEIVAWLLASRWPVRSPVWGSGGMPSPERGEALKLRRQLGTWLPSGEGSQLVTIRLPTDQHERLRTWCGEHNFTMAAVVRGLIENFLEAQAGPGSPAQPAEA